MQLRSMKDLSEAFNLTVETAREGRQSKPARLPGGIAVPFGALYARVQQMILSESPHVAGSSTTALASTCCKLMSPGSRRRISRARSTRAPTTSLSQVPHSSLLLWLLDVQT